MSKFKIGDTVKIKEDTFDFYTEYNGKIGEIIEIDKDTSNICVRPVGLLSIWVSDYDVISVNSANEEPASNTEEITNTARYETGSGKQLFEVFEDDLLTHEEYVGFLKGNVYKYMKRYKQKHGVKDLEKSRVYLDQLIKVEGKANV